MTQTAKTALGSGLTFLAVVILTMLLLSGCVPERRGSIDSCRRACLPYAALHQPPSVDWSGYSGLCLCVYPPAIQVQQ